MSRFERNARNFLIIIAIGLWALVGYDFYTHTWQAPLGTLLSLPSLIPNIGGAANPEQRAAGPTSTLIPGQATLTPYIPGFSNGPKCGGPLTMTILAVGSDSRGSGYLYGLGDVIRIVRVDFTTPRITILEFPRDIWVQIPDLDPKHGIDHGKLNQAYLYGNKGMGYYTGPSEGPGLLARTLALNFGARPDHYIAGNMQTFVKLVNAIGGIDIDLPDTVDARKADQPKRWDLYFKVGKHHLNGSQALMLARIRQQSTFERADNQNIVLCAVRKALLNPENLTKLPEIIEAFDGAIQTDLSPQQISQLACLLPSLEPQNVNFVTFPRETLKESRTFDKGVNKDVFIFEADFNVMRLYVDSFDKGQWPARVNPAPVTVTPGKTSKGETFICP